MVRAAEVLGLRGFVRSTSRATRSRPGDTRPKRSWVLDVSDPIELCGGRFKLDGGPDGATCRPSRGMADLAMGMQALGALSLGRV